MWLSRSSLLLPASVIALSLYCQPFAGIAPAAPAAGPTVCTLDTDAAGSALLFAVETHAVNIAAHIQDCRHLFGSDLDTRDNHLAYWQHSIQAEVKSMSDLVTHSAAFGHMSLRKKALVKQLEAEVLSLEEHTARAIDYLVSSPFAHSEKFYPVILGDAREHAERIVLQIETLWHCERVELN